MNSKETFLLNSDDVKFLLSVVKNPAFDRGCIYAKQAWIERLDMQQNPILAVNQFLEVLRDLPIEASPAAGLPSPALHHNLDVGPRKPQSKSKGKQ